jgi:hypothetical protein
MPRAGGSLKQMAVRLIVFLAFFFVALTVNFSMMPFDPGLFKGLLGVITAGIAASVVLAKWSEGTRALAFLGLMVTNAWILTLI